jgi:hypothetical protein
LYISQKPCFEDIHSKVLELLHANKWTDKQTDTWMGGKSFHLCSTVMYTHIKITKINNLLNQKKKNQTTVWAKKFLILL